MHLKGPGGVLVAVVQKLRLPGPARGADLAEALRGLGGGEAGKGLLQGLAEQAAVVHVHELVRCGVGPGEDEPTVLLQAEEVDAHGRGLEEVLVAPLRAFAGLRGFFARCGSGVGRFGGKLGCHGVPLVQSPWSLGEG